LFLPKRKNIQKSGDGTFLELKFEVFLQTFVHFNDKKLEKKEEKNKKTNNAR